MAVSYITPNAIGAIVNRFQVEPPGAEGTQNCSNGSGHMNNMAVMPIYGKSF